MNKCPVTGVIHKNEPESIECSASVVERLFGCKPSEMMTLKEYQEIKKGAIMKLPTQDQEDAVIAADMLLTFVVKTEFRTDSVRDLMITKILKYHGQLEPDEQNEKVFLEAAVEYVRGCHV